MIAATQAEDLRFGNGDSSPLRSSQSPKETPEGTKSIAVGGTLHKYPQRKRGAFDGTGSAPHL